MRCFMRRGAQNTAEIYVLVSCHLPGDMDMSTDNDENGDARPVVIVLLFIRECSDNCPGALVLPLEAQ